MLSGLRFPVRRRAVLPAMAIAGVITASAPAIADIQPLTLYQKTARATLVVKARALSDSTRRPELEVLEVIKGSYTDRTLVVAPHVEDYGSPTPWLKREVFSRGAESILFLDPYVDDFGRDEGPRTFAVLNAASGKVDVPSEGEGALLDAVRRFAAIQRMGQFDDQSAALRGMLDARNPYLLEAALDECRRFHIVQPADADALLGLLGNPRPDFRAGALTLLRQLVAGSAPDAIATGPTLQPAALSEIFERVAAAGRFDADAHVREAAISVLEAFSSAPALLILEKIGSSDATQSVRYAAEVAAYRLREKLH